MTEYTKAELVKRDRAQRREIAKLKKRIAALEPPLLVDEFNKYLFDAVESNSTLRFLPSRWQRTKAWLLRAWG